MRYFLAAVLYTALAATANADIGTLEALRAGDMRKLQIHSAARPAPDTVFLHGDGSELRLSDYQGKVVVLNFWATWCAPCVREMPELDRLNAALAPVGIDVLAASMDRAGHSAIAAFYEKIGITNLAALHDPKGTAARALGIRGLPTTLIIRPDGQEVARIEGIHHYDTDVTKAYLKRCIGPK